jgi:hypothetical protein
MSWLASLFGFNTSSNKRIIPTNNFSNDYDDFNDNGSDNEYDEAPFKLHVKHSRSIIMEDNTSSATKKSKIGLGEIPSFLSGSLMDIDKDDYTDINIDMTTVTYDDNFNNDDDFNNDDNFNNDTNNAEMEANQPAMLEMTDEEKRTHLNRKKCINLLIQHNVTLKYSDNLYWNITKMIDNNDNL